MSLRNQPYIPLYVQDYLTDEKLNMCSWQTQGIYIKILCILHKQENYGCILFKQNDKQKVSSIEFFANVLIRNLPCQYNDMVIAIGELISNGVLVIEDDKLYQKRMVKDGHISSERSKSAKKGGGNPNLFKQKPKQTIKQITEDENEYEIENKDAIILNTWSLNYFDEKFINKKSIDTFDKLLRIDKYTIEQIKNVIKFAREDTFWSQNILTPNKLREKNKEGVKYIDVFLARIKPVQTKSTFIPSPR